MKRNNSVRNNVSIIIRICFNATWASLSFMGESKLVLTLEISQVGGGFSVSTVDVFQMFLVT